MKLLKEQAKNHGLNLNKEQLNKFEVYEGFLLSYNKFTNLTRITDHKEILIKHFLDSLLIVNFFELKEGMKVADIGTGAGFPGIPLKILKPEIDLTLVESSSKKVAFLKELSDKLSIKYVVHHVRAEELSREKNFREKFDVVAARAVAPLAILNEYCLPYVKKDGCFLAMKGPNIQEELKNSQNITKILGGKIEKIVPFELPFGFGNRNLIIAKKIKNTPKNYPRSNAEITNSL